MIKQDKTIKIFIFLNPIVFFVVFILIGFFYIQQRFFKSEPLFVRNGAVQQDNLNKEKLEADYKTNTRHILAEYEKEKSSPELKLENIVAIKNKLTEVRTPAKFLDLHLDLVMAVIKRENFLKEGNNEEKIASERIIFEARQNNSWLN